MCEVAARATGERALEKMYRKKSLEVAAAISKIFEREQREQMEQMEQREQREQREQIKAKAALKEEMEYMELIKGNVRLNMMKGAMSAMGGMF